MPAVRFQLYPSAVATAFNEGVIVGFTESFDANADVKLLIDNFGKDIDVDTKDFEKLKTQNKTKLYEYIIEKSPYNSSKDLAKAINDKVEDLLGVMPMFQDKLLY